MSDPSTGDDRASLLQEAHFRAILETAMDAVVSVDDEQRVVLFNAAAEQMFGWGREDALGRPLDLFIPQRFRPVHRQHVRAFGTEPTGQRSMSRLGTIFGLRANGDEFPAEASISRVEVNGKNIFTVILRDLTERRRTEQALHRSEQRLSQAMENAAMGFWDWDVPSGAIDLDPRFCALLGYESGELPPRIETWQHLIHPDDCRRVFSALKRHVDGDDSLCDVEYRARSKTGDWAWVNARGRVQARDDKGRALRMIGTVQDISSRKRQDDQFREAVRLADAGTLASGLAHEIGTPMSVILGRAEYLSQRTQEQQTRKGLESIIRQVERMTRLIKRLLAFSSKTHSDLRPTDLARVIEETLDAVQERLSRHGITLEKALAGPVPLVQADPDQVSQALLNLLVNSIHAMPQGGSLRVGLQASGGAVRLTVADTGHGIPEDHLERIFAPFFTTKPADKGTGLGLAMVQNIVRDHDGTISVRSTVGQGTTFEIVLPQDVPR